MRMTPGLLAVAFGVATAAQAGDRMNITFEVDAPTTPAGDVVFIAGNLKPLGEWRADGFRLAPSSDGRWVGTVSLRKGARLEFKVTRGDWDRQALDERLRVPPNARHTVASNTTLRVRVPAWRDQQAPVSGVVGDLRMHRAIEGEGLPARDIAVWLPPDYATATNRRYPVLYMHDGQNCFDPSLAGFGMEWRMDEEATRLIGEGRIRPLIIVGMYNTADRAMEYGDTPTGERYRRFVTDVVKPMIDAEYRTLPDRANTAVMGSSMGGLVSFLLAWERPDIFFGAGCLSPAFFPPTLKRIREDAAKAPDVRLYLDNGGIGIEKRLQPGCDTMLGLLRKRGFEDGRNLEWFLDAGAEHNELAWAARVWRPLRFLFGEDAR